MFNVLRRSTQVMALAGLVLLTSLLIAAPVAAQQPAGKVAEDAISQLRSPYCPGLMLEVCPSPQAASLRDSIHALAADGLPAGEIVEWMLERHGEEWRAVPKQSGRGLWAWIIPPLALLAGAGLVVRRLRRGQEQTRITTEVTEEDTLSEAERARVAAAMRQWETSGEVDA